MEENAVTRSYFQATNDYYRNVLTWCLQKARPIQIWKNIFHLCNNPIIYLIMTLEYLIIITFAYYFQQFEPGRKWDWNKIVIEGFRCLLSFPCSYNPKNLMARAGYVLILFYAFIFSNILNIHSIYIFQNAIFDHQIQTIREIINEDFTLIGDKNVYGNVLKQNEVNSFEHIREEDKKYIHSISFTTQTYPTRSLSRFRIVKHPSDYLREIELNDKLAIALPREMLLFRTGNESDLIRNIFCFDHPNNIYESPLQLLMRKKFEFSNDLNKFIWYAKESGLIAKWLMDRRSIKGEELQLKYEALKADSFTIPIMLYSCILTMAVIVLITEVIVYKKVRTLNSLAVWRYIEMMINPDRLFYLKDLSLFGVR